MQSNVTINAIDARGLYAASMTASDDTLGRSPGKIEEYRRNSKSIEEQAMGELAEEQAELSFTTTTTLMQDSRPSRKHQKSSTCSSFLSMA